MDLAQAHVKGMNYLFQENSSSQIFNLGTEKGYTAKKSLKTAEELLNQKIPHEIVARRAGDPASVLADASKAKQYLDWQASYSLEDIIFIRIIVGGLKRGIIFWNNKTEEKVLGLSPCFIY